MERIILEPYNNSWPLKFLEEKELISMALPLPLEIHHVGSTAVPDLLSKPIIDIGIECNEFPPSEIICKRLFQLGYEFQGESGVSGRIWFTKGLPRQFNLHFCALGSEVIRRQLSFRDLLRADKNLRRAYERIKMENSKGCHIDDSDYAASKTMLIMDYLKGGGHG